MVGIFTVLSIFKLPEQIGWCSMGGVTNINKGDGKTNVERTDSRCRLVLVGRLGDLLFDGRRSCTEESSLKNPVCPVATFSR